MPTNSDQQAIEATVLHMDTFVLRRMTRFAAKGHFVSFFKQLTGAEQLLEFEIPWLAHDLQIADEDIEDWARGRNIPKTHQRTLMFRVVSYLKNKKQEKE